MSLWIQLLLLTLVGNVPDLGDVPLDEPLTTERPTLAPSPYVLGLGRFQGEGGTTYAFRDEDDELAVGELHLRVAFAEGWELQVLFGSFETLDTAGGRRSGWGGLGLGFKRRLSVQKGARPASAVLISTTLPWGSSATSPEDAEPGLDLMAGWRIAPRATLRAAVGYDRLDGGVDQVSAGLVAGLEHGRRWTSFAELYATSDDVRDRTYLQLGALYHFYDFQIDLRVGTDFDGDDPTRLVGVGFTVKW